MQPLQQQLTEPVLLQMQSKGMPGVTLEAGEGMVPTPARRKLKMAQHLHPVAMLEKISQQA
jgi:hypothetical protein